MDDDLLDLLQNDETYKQFLDVDFDDRVYANSIIQGRAISESLGKLADGVSLVDKELHAQVVAHHDDLLQQAIGIETLEGVLQMMQGRINSLMASVGRIQQQVNEPYSKIVSRTAQLRRLQEACDILRRIIRVLYLTKRLKAQLDGGVREITKAAQSLCELDYLLQGADLTGVQVVENDMKVITDAKTKVVEQAQKMLVQGIEAQNQTQVATALQVFYNLGSLSVTVENTVNKLKDSLKKSMNGALQASVQSQTQGTGQSNTAAMRAMLWTEMEKLMDVTYSICAQVYHLQKVLAKKRDPVTHVCFMEELVKEGGNSVNTFWKSVTEVLADEFATASKDSTFLKQAFEGEYPKVLRLYNDLWSRLQQFSSPSTVATSTISPNEVLFGLFQAADNSETSPEQALKKSLSVFETAYLSRSLSRLFDPINLVFPSGARNPPSKEELMSIAKTISSELSVASVDAGLTITVARNVAKTVDMFTAKCEQLLPGSPEASQVHGHVTSGQQRSAATVNSLYQLYQAVTKIVSGFKSPPDVAVDAMMTALQGMLSLIHQAVDPLIKAIMVELENLIYRIHAEDFTSTSLAKYSDDIPDAPCSSYIKDIEDFILNVQRTHLSMYECKDILMARLEPVASRVLELFVRHTSLLRNIGEGGKLKLAADMAQIEFAVGPFCHKVSDLGKPYKLLRSFRPLLFQTSQDIVGNPALGESLPYNIVAHYLFSRAPSEVKSPFEVAGWTISYYSQWLDEHPSEDERLALIRGTLEAYVNAVRSRGEKEYAPIYPVMLQILQASSA